MVKKEWTALFKSRRLMISILGIISIPILYGFMFIWAFYDPYGKLETLPIAIVNNDEGSELNGETINIGETLVNQLKEKDGFNFHFVDKETGYHDLKDNKFYLLIEIPNDFSKNATSVMDEHPEKLELIYVPNEGYNYIASQIGTNMIKEIQISIQEEVTKSYTNIMFESIRKMVDGYESIYDASTEFNTGATKIYDGSKSLEEGINELAKNQTSFASATGELANGSQELYSGTNQLADGLGQLLNGQQQLVNGANQAVTGSVSLQDGVKQLNRGLGITVEKIDEIISGTEKLAEGTQLLTGGLGELQNAATLTSQGVTSIKNSFASLKEQLEPVIANLPANNQGAIQQALEQLTVGIASLESGNMEIANAAELLSTNSTEIAMNLHAVNEGQKAMKNGLVELKEGANALEIGTDKLVAGQQGLSGGLQTFADKLAEAKTGSEALLSGVDQLTSGVQKLQNGANALADGANQLASGSVELTAGTKELMEGTEKFHQEIGNAIEEANEIELTEQAEEMIASPVEVKTEKVNQVPNYGTGFTPYFLSLALFVGALTFTVVFPVRNPVSKPNSAFSWFFSKFTVFAAVGIIQAVLLASLILFVLQVEVQSVPMFYLFAIITSLSFMALTQFFSTTMNDPGRYFVIIIMILQLTTSAGTFPLEMIPESLQKFNPYLPMTYSVQGFKEIISSGNFSFIWSNTYVLIGFLLAFMLFTLCYFIYKYKKAFSDNHAAFVE